MADWQDDGIVLGTRPHGETAAVVTLLTRAQGRHAGLLPGGQSRTKQSWLQPGQQVVANWRARLSEQLGTFTLEPSQPYPSAVLDNALALAGLSSACSVADAALPEREPHPALFEGLAALMETFDNPVWPYAYVRWELGLLREIGYGMELDFCALTHQPDSPDDPLEYVSPRTGRAVCRSAAAPYKEKLLVLPGFLVGRGAPTTEELLAGLRLTGFFLERSVFAVHHAPLPAARVRLVEKLLQSELVE